MAFSESLASRVRDALARTRGVAEKKMFGGLVFLLNGNMLVCVRKDSLIVRLGPEGGEQALREPHVRVFDSGGRTIKGWVVVDPDGLEYDEALRTWLTRASAFVGVLPAK